jgi:uncharacterized tellurite resistance protein B-like protein
MRTTLDPNIQAMADILMAAAYADGSLALEEEALVREILAAEIAEPTLPPEVLEHLQAFEPDTFELNEACAQLGLQGKAERRRLLRLVAEVTEVDAIHDLDESHFIRRVGRCIGARPEEYEDLTIDATSAPEGHDLPPPTPGK